MHVTAIGDGRLARLCCGVEFFGSEEILLAPPTFVPALTNDPGSRGSVSGIGGDLGHHLGFATRRGKMRAAQVVGPFVEVNMCVTKSRKNKAAFYVDLVSAGCRQGEHGLI